MATLLTRSRKVEKAHPMSIRLSVEEAAKAEKFASVEQRSRASFVRLMFLKGLEAYEREQAHSSKTLAPRRVPRK